MQESTASTTARRVAAHRSGFDRVPAPYGDPDADLQLQSAVGAPVRASLGTESSSMVDYLRRRTAYFDSFVVEQIDGGTRQLVLVGAGYDGRSLRYARDDVRWFELDHPATQADKVAQLDALGLAATHVRFAAADFGTTRADEALIAAGFDPTEPAAFLCEGVTGYLPEDVVVALLRALREAAAPGSVFALTMPLQPTSIDEQRKRERLTGAVAAMGEPMVSVYDRSRLPEFFRDTGWEVVSATDTLGVSIDRSRLSMALVRCIPCGA